MVEQRKVRGWRQQFTGFRVNCEGVPLLPAWAVRWYLDDPRQMPYLLVWKSPWDGEVKETVRIARFVPPPHFPAADDMVEVKRNDGRASVLRFLWRPLPRNGAHELLILCPYCEIPRRSLYGWEANEWRRSVTRTTWQCRTCAGLRYASEGQALLIRGRGTLSRLLEREFGPSRSDRPEPWEPLVFTRPEQAIEASL